MKRVLTFILDTRGQFYAFATGRRNRYMLSKIVFQEVIKSRQMLQDGRVTKIPKFPC